jgi:hypothetical protein
MKFNVYPNATESITQEYPVGTDAEIEVTGNNHRSWEVFFEDSGQYDITGTGSNNVTAEVTNSYFEVTTSYVAFNRTRS